MDAGVSHCRLGSRLRLGLGAIRASFFGLGCWLVKVQVIKLKLRQGFRARCYGYG